MALLKSAKCGIAVFSIFSDVYVHVLPSTFGHHAYVYVSVGMENAGERDWETEKGHHGGASLFWA